MANYMDTVPVKQWKVQNDLDPLELRELMESKVISLQYAGRLSHINSVN